MSGVLNFYIDDSGTRHPTRNPGRRAAHGYDWFAFGGVLIDDEEEGEARRLHKEFCESWRINGPLHSSEIRSKNESFLWLRSLSDIDQRRFYEELYCTMRDAPVIGLSCVVDRPGYNARYLEMYQKNPWSLCKTAFNIAVERAAKFAWKNDRKLRILPERCNKSEDRLLKDYYLQIKQDGMPFSKGNSEKYSPLNSEELSDILFDFKLKYKTSPLAQFADLYLWPICMGGYHKSNVPYQRLLSDGKLIENRLDPADFEKLATKYSCFENVVPNP